MILRRDLVGPADDACLARALRRPALDAAPDVGVEKSVDPHHLRRGDLGELVVRPRLLLVAHPRHLTLALGG